jgi:hypothetical protein
MRVFMVFAVIAIWPAEALSAAPVYSEFIAGLDRDQVSLESTVSQLDWFTVSRVNPEAYGLDFGRSLESDRQRIIPFVGLGGSKSGRLTFNLGVREQKQLWSTPVKFNQEPYGTVLLDVEGRCLLEQDRLPGLRLTYRVTWTYPRRSARSVGFVGTQEFRRQANTYFFAAFGSWELPPGTIRVYAHSAVRLQDVFSRVEYVVRR